MGCVHEKSDSISNFMAVSRSFNTPERLTDSAMLAANPFNVARPVVNSNFKTCFPDWLVKKDTDKDNDNLLMGRIC